MVNFASCNPLIVPASDADYCKGFSACGVNGIAPTSENINSVLLRILQQSAALDINALATALCGNAIFQACVITLSSGVPIAPTRPSAGPFINSGIAGAVMSITHGTFGGTTPISLTATGLPAGVTFTDNGNATYTLTGTWPIAGTYPYTVLAANVAGSTAMTGNQLISTAAAVNPILPAAGPFTDTGIAGTPI